MNFFYASTYRNHFYNRPVIQTLGKFPMSTALVLWKNIGWSFFTFLLHITGSVYLSIFGKCIEFTAPHKIINPSNFWIESYSDSSLLCDIISQNHCCDMCCICILIYQNIDSDNICLVFFEFPPFFDFM